MPNQQLIEFINGQLNQGVPRETISNDLLSKGWQQQDIVNAFASIENTKNITNPSSNVPSSDNLIQTFTTSTDSNISEENSEKDPRKNKVAIIGLILGLFGLIAWFIPLFGLPITISGLVLSIKGLKSSKKSMAIAGIVLSTIGLVASIVNASIGAYMGATGQHSFVNQYVKNDNNKTDISETENIDLKSQLIEQVIQEVKTQYTLPAQIDQATTWVDITAEPNALRYHYTISGINTSGISNNYLKTNLISEICENKDTRNILNQDINLEYSYSVENSSDTFFVTITKADCY